LPAPCRGLTGPGQAASERSHTAISNLEVLNVTNTTDTRSFGGRFPAPADSVRDGLGHPAPEQDSVRNGVGNP
jgi:hypothetical protein